jgi:hypothetical protein
LGIILSVATLIVVIELISGVNQYIANKVANLGSNAFTVMGLQILKDGGNVGYPFGSCKVVGITT